MGCNLDEGGLVIILSNDLDAVCRAGVLMTLSFMNLNCLKHVLCESIIVISPHDCFIYKTSMIIGVNWVGQ